MTEAEPLLAPIRIRSARESDVPLIMDLMGPYVQRRLLLPRDEHEVRTLLRHGFTAESGGMLVGFAAVEIYSRKLAEIQCLAVSADWHRKGVGKRLVQACIERARELNVLELMAITSSEELFMACGFNYALPGQKKAVFIHTREEHGRGDGAEGHSRNPE
jgi:amino-acid N-acetyltransferase